MGLHLLDRAHRGGVQKFVIVANTENEVQARGWTRSEKFLGDSEVVVQENLETGMAGGVSIGLKSFLDDEPVMILGGNDWVNVSAYKEVIKTGEKNDGAILAQKISAYFPGGYLSLNKKGIISHIVEKPGEGNEPSDLVNIVLHYFSKAETIKSALNTTNQSHGDAYEKALEKIFSTHQIIAVPYEKPWQAVKYPWHILEVMQMLWKEISAQKISPDAEIAKTAVINGRVIIESGAKILDHAVIQGPCFIGKNSVIGNGCLIRQSHIGAESIIGFHTEIARSFLRKKVTTHHTYIGDSVVDQGVNFGAFSTTANQRLDKKHVQVRIKEEKIDSHCPKLGAFIGSETQIGAHSVIMPGKIIEAESQVMPLDWGAR